MENNIKTRIASYLYAVLSLAALIMLVFTLVRTRDTSMLLAVEAAMLMIVFAAYYCFIGYKKPHGNLMRILFVVFAITFSIESCAGQQSSLLMTVFTIIVIIGSAYVAGRLGRNTEATIIMIIVLIALIGILIICCVEKPPVPDQGAMDMVQGAKGYAEIPDPVKSPVAAIFLGRTGIAISNVYSWIVLSIAYTIRYKQHKEAGFADASKN